MAILEFYLMSDIKLLLIIILICLCMMRPKKILSASLFDVYLICMSYAR